MTRLRWSRSSRIYTVELPGCLLRRKRATSIYTSKCGALLKTSAWQPPQQRTSVTHLTPCTRQLTNFKTQSLRASRMKKRASSTRRLVKFSQSMPNRRMRCRSILRKRRRSSSNIMRAKVRESGPLQVTLLEWTLHMPRCRELSQRSKSFFLIRRTRPSGRTRRWRA